MSQSQLATPRANFIQVENLLKKKVGNGGIDPIIVERAENTLKNSDPDDFVKEALVALEVIKQIITKYETISLDNDLDHNAALYEFELAFMPIKSHGQMFNFPFASQVAGLCNKFLEDIETLDQDILEIVRAFHTSLDIVVKKRIMVQSGQLESMMLKELSEVCGRYFKKLEEAKA